MTEKIDTESLYGSIITIKDAIGRTEEMIAALVEFFDNDNMEAFWEGKDMVSYYNKYIKLFTDCSAQLYNMETYIEYLTKIYTYVYNKDNECSQLLNE